MNYKFKTIFATLIVTILLSSNLLADATHLESGDDMRIVSVNLHCLHDSWQTRFDHILDEIVKVDPEIISFQEVCKYNGEDGVAFLREGLEARGWNIRSSARKFTHISFDKYREYVFIVSRAEASETIEQRLPESPLQRSYVGLKIDNVWYIDLHLEYSKEWANYRRTQIEYLTAKFENQAVVFMGDWNSNAVDPEQEPLANRGYTPFFPGLSYPSDAPEIAIDGLWFSPDYPFSLQNAEASLFLDAPVFGNLFPSDHLGLVFKSNE